MSMHCGEKTDTIEAVLKRTTEENQDQVDWTGVWSSKYPVLKEYRQKVDVPHYAARIRQLLSELRDTYGYDEQDAMLVLKDILAHEYMKKQG